MELIFGVPPLSQFDAAATPMTAAFSGSPDLTPYTALQPKVSLWATNQAGDPMTAESGTIDFAEPDLIPMDLMNRILWQSVRGAGSSWQSPSTPPQPASTVTVAEPDGG
jgi:hypothetical protein